MVAGLLEGPHVPVDPCRREVEDSRRRKVPLHADGDLRQELHEGVDDGRKLVTAAATPPIVLYILKRPNADFELRLVDGPDGLRVRWRPGAGRTP